MKSIFVLPLMMSSLAFAAAEPMSSPIRSSAEIETSCRVKAKEVAADTYRSCVTDQKNSQIEQIKKEYQAKLQALRSHYESELKKMGTAKSKASIEDSDSSPVAPSEKGASVKMPSKKLSKAALAKRSKQKAVAAPVTDGEMTVQLKPAPITPAGDESVMDIPEPIPVDSDMKSDSSI